MAKRILSDEEKKIWEQTIKTVSPLVSDKTVQSSAPSLSTNLHNSSDLTFSLKPIPKIQATTKNLPQNCQPPAPLCILKLSAKDIKKASIDARLDLHGYTVEQSLKALERFIVASQERGYKWILIITGKGNPGTLKRFVPSWLSEHLQWIVGYAKAPPKQGGDGALYVRIRKKKTGSS